MDLIERYILVLSEKLSITKAANQLNISQPALSSALTKREGELGYAIFNRKTSPISLTAEGSLYIDFLKEKKILETNLAKQINDLKESHQTELYLGAPTAYITPYVLPAISELIRSLPSTRIRIIEGTVSDLMEKAEKGAIDLFISTTDLVPSHFMIQALFDEQVFLCSYRPIRLTSEGTPDWSDLADDYCIQLGDRQPLQTQVNAYQQKNNFTPRRISEVAHTSSAIKLVSDKCGFCFATNSTLSASDGGHLLYTYQLPKEDFLRKIYIAAPSSRKMTFVQEEFINILKRRGEKTK